MKGLLAVLILGSAAYAQTPSVAAGGILNAASFDKTQPVTPGSLISIFGSNLAALTATADSIPLSTVLGNVKVSINGTNAPLLGVFHTASGDQINAQLPWGTQAGQAQVVVNNNGIPSPAQTFQVGPFSPGIFSVNFGTGQAIAINPDGSLAAPAGSIPGLNTRPHKLGSDQFLIILATGLGAVSPPAAVGNNTLDGLRTNTTTPSVLVGGSPVTVLFSGLSQQFVGVNQINVQLPPGTPTGNAVPIQIQVGGLTSTSQVTIAVQ
jgi:uncharacterized protein (TIGR03437 family)